MTYFITLRLNISQKATNSPQKHLISSHALGLTDCTLLGLALMRKFSNFEVLFTPFFIRLISISSFILLFLFYNTRLHRIEGILYDKSVLASFVKALNARFMERNLTLISTFIGDSEQILKTFHYYSVTFEYCSYIDFKFSQNHTEITVTDRLKHLSFYKLQDMIGNLIEMGVPPSKIFMGFDLKATILRATDPPTLKERAYNETYHQESGATIQYSTDSESKNKFYTEIQIFEKPRGIANRIRFAIRNNLAGVLIKNANYDGDDVVDVRDAFGDYKPIPGVQLYIPPRCSSSRKQLINEAIAICLNEIDQETHIQIWTERLAKCKAIAN